MDIQLGFLWLQNVEGCLPKIPVAATGPLAVPAYVVLFLLLCCCSVAKLCPTLCNPTGKEFRIFQPLKNFWVLVPWNCACQYSWQEKLVDVFRVKMLRWGDYSGARYITRVFLSGIQEIRVESKAVITGQEVWVTWGGATSQGMRAASRSWRRWGWSSQLEPREGTMPANNSILIL